jgi:hypothetical protein
MIRVREVLGAVLLGPCLLFWGCGGDDDKPPNGSGGSGSGSGGATATSGAAGKGGSAGSTSAGNSSSGGSPPAGGSSAGNAAQSGAASSGGTGTAGAELAVSRNACAPECAEHQYCALEEIDCSGEPCLVRAVCRDYPACDASHECSKEKERCFCDPRTECSVPDPNYQGICVCTENTGGCNEQILDERPSVCACVPDVQAPNLGCLNIDCPDDFDCEEVIGKAYCFSTGPG